MPYENKEKSAQIPLNICVSLGSLLNCLNREKKTFIIDSVTAQSGNW